MLEDLRGLGLPLELGFLLFCQLSLQIRIKASAIYSDECIFNSYNVGMLRFTFELVLMDFWTLMMGSLIWKINGPV